MFAFLKQSTASQARILGPFVDDTDFKTLETALTIANTDVKLSKNGAAAVNKNVGGGSHIINGNYAFTFDATDTNTVGELHVSISVVGALIVVGKFWVLEEAIYDALIGAAAGGFDASQRVDVGTWLGIAPNALVTGRVDSEVPAAGFAQAAADKVWSSTARTLTAFSTALAVSVWDVLETAVVTAASMGLKVKNNLDTAVSSRATQAQILSDATPFAGANIDATISSRGTAANQTTILNRLGDFGATGLNTVKGFLQALFRKDAGVSGANQPAEINEVENTIAGTYDAATDSQEATRDTAPLGTAMRGTDSAALASVCTEARLSELDAATGGKAANQIDLIKTETDKIAVADAGAGVAGSVIEEIENRATPVQVNTEVLDVLNTDTFTEPGQEAPPVTASVVKKIGYLYKFLRNRVTSTTTQISVFNDDATTIAHKSTHSDDGTTYDRGEFGSGP